MRRVGFPREVTSPFENAALDRGRARPAQRPAPGSATAPGGVPRRLRPRHRRPATRALVTVQDERDTMLTVGIGLLSLSAPPMLRAAVSQRPGPT
ncbi:hypothetical protein, partial [Streptomyces clavuligerus]|uniref:hypothetical protein n=1 Tax=Streptomyces clavuligerus TaxID=1901 RepID=UPI0018D02E98